MNKSYIWYAGYGSNLCEKRFLCYIQGGVPPFGKIPASGCYDPTPPIETSTLSIPYELYFALPNRCLKTSNWGEGGVAFVEPDINKNNSTLCRLWKITKEQYEEVRSQEGRSWYGYEINLGEKEGAPIVTITNEKSLNNIIRPSSDYLKTVCRGLKESFNMEGNDIAEYMSSRRGIKGNYSIEDLMGIVYESK